MRIAIVHSEYRKSSPSGENSAVYQLVEMLAQRGHDVLTVMERSPDFPNLRFKLRSFVNVSFETGISPDYTFSKFRPDVIHAHNLFPNFSSSWLEKWGKMTVKTIHNYRALCANALLFRDGQFCDDCQIKGAISAVKNSCYKDSTLGSIPFFLNSEIAKLKKPSISKFKSLIFLNEIARMKHIPLLDKNQRTYVIPNLIQTHFTPQSCDTPNDYLVFAGLLSIEKGILKLAENWTQEMPELKILGSGPLEKEIREISNRKKNVDFVGLKKRDELLSIVSQSKGVIIPSLCMEMLPNIYVESLSQGIPVIAYHTNASANLVQSEKTGVVLYAFSQLKYAVDNLFRNWVNYSQSSLNAYSTIYSMDAVYKRISEVYLECIASQE